MTVHSKASHSSKKNVKEDLDVNKISCAKEKAAFTNQPIELSLSLETEPKKGKTFLPLYPIWHYYDKRMLK